MPGSILVLSIIEKKENIGGQMRHTKLKTLILSEIKKGKFECVRLGLKHNFTIHNSKHT